MGYLNDLLSRVQAVNLQTLIEETLVDAEEDLVAAQKGQWAAGENAHGYALGELQDEGYAREKTRRLNPFVIDDPADFGTYDLYNEGNFYADTYAFVSGDELVFDSSNSKTKEIEALVGSDELLFGLNENYKGVAIDEITPEFNKKVQSAFGLPKKK